MMSVISGHDIFPQQFSLQIARTLSIEFVELLLYLKFKTNRFRFSMRSTVIDHDRRRHIGGYTKSHGTQLRLLPTFFSTLRHRSSVIYYSTHARQNEIYLLIKDGPLDF